MTQIGIAYHRGASGSAVRFQPRLALRSGRPLGAELFVRRASVRDRLTASVEAGDLVAACGVARAWRQGLPLLISVTRRQMRAGRLLDIVFDALRGSGLPGDRLELALTEGALLDISADMLVGLSALRDAGVGLILDDFGMGEVRLGLLRRVPLTGIRLSAQTVQSLAWNVDEGAIAQGIIAAGRAQSLALMADGIETESQRDALLAWGCEAGQGPMFSAALDPGTLGRAFQAFAADEPVMAA